MLRHGMPSYRMPHEVLDRDIKNITALGVEIRCNTPVESLASLKEQGFDAIFVGVGNQVPRIIPLQGRDLADVTDCMQFLRETKCEHLEMPDLAGRHVVVLGGGNVALDVARSAVRLGTASTTILCLEDREHMPAHAWEVQEAEEEGVRLVPSASAKTLLTDEGGRPLLEYLAVGSIEFTPEGRLVGFKVAEGSEQRLPADVVILAVGLAPSTAAFAGDLELTPQRTIRTDPETLQTSDPMVFAGGDAVLGPSIIVEAMGQGRRAAYHIDAMLRGHSPIARFWDKPPVVDKAALLKAQEGHTWLPPSALRRLAPHERVQSFEAYEDAFTEEEARAAANRCLSCGGCSQCQECVRVLPGRLHRLHHARRAPQPRGGGGDHRHRLRDPRPGQEPAPGLRAVPERDLGPADGPPAGAHPPVQHGAAPLRRQGARQHRHRAVQRLARPHRWAIRSAAGSAACTPPSTPS